MSALIARLLPVALPHCSPWLLSPLILLAAMVTALLNGAMALPLQSLWGGEQFAAEQAVLWHIRLPRVLLAVLVGGSLAYAGAAIQGLFRNPLAEPGLIGVASGSALAVGLYIVFLDGVLSGYWALYGINLFAFVGGCAVSFFVLKVVRRWAGGSVVALLLVGLAINAITMSGNGLLTYISDDQQLRTMTFWTMGSLGRAEWGSLLASATLIVPALLWLRRYAVALDLMQLGERETEYSGFEVRRIQRNVIIASAVLVGAAVAAAGVVGFVGLIVPHLVRLLWG
ncbi:MAG: iron ABC transporter permease, partial [Porticoccaceae bacterium]|nr:iron ABC transporter permease [Porticoccaceae bacterium]